MGEWLVIPCNGIGNPLSTVSRYAGLQATKLLQERGVNVDLLAIGQLLARLPDALERLANRPAAVIDGCSYKCATKLLENLGAKPAVHIYIPDVMRSLGLGKRGLDRKYLGPKGRAIGEAVAKALADAVTPMIDCREPTEALESNACCGKKEGAK
jgi:uncharacterized metal-binding protein